MRRTVRYPAIGILLGLGAPAGLLLLHAMAQDVVPSWSWVVIELRARSLDYVYLTLSTAIAFAVPGILLARREERLVASSLTDSLTGLWNRRHVVARLREELSRAVRYQQPLSLLFIDVDRFKQINDRDGHSAGDAALRRVAEAISGSCRSTDLAARYGGDEFAVLAPNTLAEDGVALAERIRRAVTTIGGPNLSVSIGVADLRDVAGQLGLPDRAVDVNDMCVAADDALYRAKAEGRDRVERLQTDRPRKAGDPVDQSGQGAIRAHTSGTTR